MVFERVLTSVCTFFSDKFDYASMMAETKIIGPVMFGFFCLIFNIVLINFFITVILEGFTAVRNDENKQSNEYEIVDFIIRRTRMTLGIGQPKKRNTKRAQGLMSDPKKDQFVYIESKYKKDLSILRVNSKRYVCIESKNKKVFLY